MLGRYHSLLWHVVRVTSAQHSQMGLEIPPANSARPHVTADESDRAKWGAVDVDPRSSMRSSRAGDGWEIKRRSGFGDKEGTEEK